MQQGHLVRCQWFDNPRVIFSYRISISCMVTIRFHYRLLAVFVNIQRKFKLKIRITESPASLLHRQSSFASIQATRNGVHFKGQQTDRLNTSNLADTNSRQIKQCFMLNYKFEINFTQPELATDTRHCDIPLNGPSLFFV